ncbi:hypothetical protein [Castellaniella defragrans]|uniref:Uncharacterized protein n=1 Tax=Castellaniella defragrans TaxID=75697 RepID=A0A7W9TS46_CASDE|nr:hypothetical protein [Castellaniella defragrans]KAB0617118.1 hypothetical protein F7Q88_07915 [Castellaniella defragrans]MBB6084542.1 hypothetical protein [Castellaniella defragrans]
MSAATSSYRGSEKHKDRPAQGAKGTLCPEWTHATSTRNLGNDPFDHEWPQTEAHDLFENALPHPQGEERRYATRKGIAFEAKPTNDGHWHGYPIPWESVPGDLVDKWLTENLVTNRQIKKYRSFSRSNIDWALNSDTQ